MENNNTIGNAIKRLRKKKELTQEELAILMQINGVDLTRSTYICITCISS